MADTGSSWVSAQISRAGTAAARPASLPRVGMLYLAEDTGALSRWDGASYVDVAGGGGGGLTEEQVEDAVALLIQDNADLDWTYTDASDALVAVIKNDAVTYAKMQNVSETDRLLGRDTAGAGDVEELTVGGGLEFTGTGIQIAANGVTAAKVAADVATQAELDAVAAAYDDATAAETTTGTSTAKYVSPDGLAGSVYGVEVAEVAFTDLTTALTVGDGKAFYVVPTKINGWNLIRAHVALCVAQSSSGVPTIQIANVTQAADMLTTKITVDANESTSHTAAVAHVVDAANDDVATGDILRIDCDVAGTGAKGGIVIMEFQAP